ncbi:MAG TPA: C39 family peptidase [Bacillota bacterium]|nr:C39 family peptidase [Bacillota bacterium]
MKIKETVILTIVSFFLFHQTTFSPVGQLASADDSIASQLVEQVDWDHLVSGRSKKASLDIPVIRQLPELYNGCEVTSLSMLLTAAGTPKDKVQLAYQLPKDSTEFKGNSMTDITEWGDPNSGFVGDITGDARGYGVNSGPIYQLLGKYLPDRAMNLTGKDFSAVEWMIDQGSPVIAWTTTNFQPTDDWVTWKKGNQTIKVTFKEHVVLIVGYDTKYVYLNDPLTGNKNEKALKSMFISSWNQLGNQAITFAGKKAMLALSE